MLKLYHNHLWQFPPRVDCATGERDPFELVSQPDGDQFQPEFLALNPSITFQSGGRRL